MTSITQFSNQVSDNLRHNRQEVSRLSQAHNTLQGLQFILELPERLSEALAEGSEEQAVEYWLRTEASLTSYRDLPSFSGIQEDCERIMGGLEERLRKRLEEPGCDPQELGKAVELLR